MQKTVAEPAFDAAHSVAVPSARDVVQTSTFSFVLALSFAHLLNDVMQSLLPAIYPLIKTTYALDFGQIGLLSLAFQLTASVLQPVVGFYTDRKPRPYSTVAGMGCTLIGLLILSRAGSFGTLMIGAMCIGTGSSIFHPEATRMARAASGGRHGFAQSLFQVGGQAGQALGPLLAAFIVVPRGQGSLAAFSVIALLAMFVLSKVGAWYSSHQAQPAPKTMPLSSAAAGSKWTGAIPAAAVTPLAVLLVLMFSKSAYTSSLSTYLTFYMIEKFNVTVQASQIILFVFLIAQAAGSLIGGYVGDRVGRHQIIWFSILGALPFTLLLPYAGFNMTIVLVTVIGMIMASAFPAILVYAMELLPGRIGAVAGAFYGLTFGLGALSAAVLGKVADWTSLATVYEICAFLPVIGLAAWFLPRLKSETH